MKLQIRQPYIDALIDEFSDLATLKEQLKFGDKVELAFDRLSEEQFAFLIGLYRRAGPEMQIQAAYLRRDGKTDSSCSQR